jgi:hypothetical protein
VKIAIILSCLISAGLITSYNIVMGQVKNLEEFYSHMDIYAQAAVSDNNSPENPYVPEPLHKLSQPSLQK